jgi:hypothetical protein
MPSPPRAASLPALARHRPFGGRGTLLVAPIGMRLFPELRRVDSLERERPEGATK